MSVNDPKTLWNTWREEARQRAEKRWAAALRMERPSRKGKDWLQQTVMCLTRLTQMGILQPREAGRLKEIQLRALAGSDRKRLEGAGIGSHVYAFGLAQDPAAPGEPLASRSLQLNDGQRLRRARLGLQVFIDEREGKPVGMNIQLRGTDPGRGERPVYLRYDLDAVQMGSGPVAHFNAHWHMGEDPDADEAEDRDARMPSLPLDPLAVIETLVETFYPSGPEDLAREP